MNKNLKNCQQYFLSDYLLFKDGNIGNRKRKRLQNQKTINQNVDGKNLILELAHQKKLFIRMPL